jgi:hypothetical protein
MTAEHLAKIYDQYFDEMYLPQYKRVQPGVQMERLDAEVAEKKNLIRQSRIDFGDTPTGIDNTPLKPEYSYGNGESMSHVDLAGGVRRNFFFFSDRLWKVYDEYPLKEGSRLGLTFEDAVKRLSEWFGSEPAMTERSARHPYPEAVWTGRTMIIRAINREPMLAVVFVDKSVETDLARRRTGGMRNPQAIDKDVAAIRRSKKGPPGPPPKK